MSQFRTTLILGLFVVCMLLAAGCTIFKTENGINQKIENPLIPPTTPIPTTTQILPLTVQPSIYWIKIDPVRDKQVGEIFSINSTTNLSVGDEIFVQVYKLQYHSHRGQEFSGGIETVNVIPGGNGINTISLAINSTAFNLVPDEYQIIEDGIYRDSMGKVQSYTTAEARFNITSGKTL